MLTLFLYSVIFIYGIVIGSFLNVCIFRIPGGESVSKERSHCMSCGHMLHWYDLFPIFSYLALRGKCRYCGAHISVQYPIIEALNGVIWMLCFAFGGFNEPNGYPDFVHLALECGVCSALIVLSIIDYRTREIPVSANIVIAVLGVCRVILDYENWPEYVIGAFAVSGVFMIAWLVTKGRGMGGGDIKLMAAAGLFLGWKLILLAMIVGCFLAVVIHLWRMKFRGAGHDLAFGPYLAAGIVFAMWWGPALLEWYISII